MANKIVPDTSIIIDGKISKILEEGKIRNVEIIIPLAVVAELQAQASRGKEVGFIGLNELKKIREICKKLKYKTRFLGERPSIEEIKLAKAGRIDAMIMDVAKKENGTLYTADYVQALVAEAEGIKVEYIAPEIKIKGLKFEQFFDSNTLSIHLKEGVRPLAKKGKPGEFKLVELSKNEMKEEELEEIIREILEAARISEEGYFEIARHGATVVQLNNYRISIARPPFSDGLEVTIVRPLVKLSLEDYKLSEKLLKRLKERAEGILIAGPPGSGKTTLASSLAEFYMKQGKIVKTLESPRDLQVSKEITQYSPLEGDFEKTADLLFLVRPDYSIFDEVRKTKDFQVFSDLRLAGVGMVGVVHASEAIDAIQRFLSRVELGMIPHIVDTIIFVKNGKIEKVYELSLIVKVPTGMTEADLARPVVEVRDFESGKLEYEIYSYGEENVVVPIKKEESNLKKLASERIFEEIKRYDPSAVVEIISEDKALLKMDNRAIGKIIGKNGKNISNLEKKLGISLIVEPKTPTLGKEVYFDYVESGKSLIFYFNKSLIGKKASFYVDGKFLFSATIGKNSNIKISKESEIGKKLFQSLISKKIKVFV